MARVTLVVHNCSKINRDVSTECGPQRQTPGARQSTQCYCSFNAFASTELFRNIVNNYAESLLFSNTARLVEKQHKFEIQWARGFDCNSIEPQRTVISVYKNNIDFFKGRTKTYGLVVYHVCFEWIKHDIVRTGGGVAKIAKNLTRWNDIAKFEYRSKRMWRNS